MKLPEKNPERPAREIPVKTAAQEHKTSYWDNQNSNWLLTILIIVCPLAGVAVASNKRKSWFSSAKISFVLIAWLTAWFVLLGVATHKPLPYTHPAYKSSVTLSTQDDSSLNNQKLPTLSSTQQKSTTTQPASSTAAQPQESQPTGVMSGVKEANAENVPYDRSEYQPNWSAGSGCDIRSRILTSSSLVAVKYSSSGCTVVYGSWKDPYTGQVLTGDPYQGDGTANDLDIDHIIPLGYVNSHGGYYWSATQKRAYGDSLTAMNNGVYLAVSASQNRSKGDEGPSEYYPPNPAYKCKYSEEWRDIARTYSISLSPADYNIVYKTLVSCGVK